MAAISYSNTKANLNLKKSLTVGSLAPNADDVEIRIADGAFTKTADVEMVVRRLLDMMRERWQRIGRIA